jgi:hypothetical protein
MFLAILGEAQGAVRSEEEAARQEAAAAELRKEKKKAKEKEEARKRRRSKPSLAHQSTSATHDHRERPARESRESRWRVVC